MSITDHNPFDERVLATYTSRDKVNQAYVVLRRKLGLADASMQILGPKHSKLSETLEGNSELIGQSMLILHICYASLGLVSGLLLATLLVQYGPPLFNNSPVFTYIALISPGIFIGLFIAGLRSLKPERDPINISIVESAQAGDWALVIDTDSLPVSKNAVVEEIESTGCLDIKK